MRQHYTIRTIQQIELTDILDVACEEIEKQSLARWRDLVASVTSGGHSQFGRIAVHAAFAQQQTVESVQQFLRKIAEWSLRFSRQALAGPVRLARPKVLLPESSRQQGSLLEAEIRVANDGLDAVGLDPEDLVFPPVTPELIKRLLFGRSGQYRWAERIAQSTGLGAPQAIAQTISWGLNQGHTQQQIVRDILPQVGGAVASARRVVRNEGLRVAQHAALENYESLGSVVVAYQIHATLDANTRPEHAARNGTVYWKQPKNGQPGVDRMPVPPQEDDGRIAHNCRCFLTPVLAPPENVIRDQDSLDLFAQANQQSPDLLIFSDWWTDASEKKKKLAVGVDRYNAVQDAIGGKEPKLEHFVSVSGELLEKGDLERESSFERASRVNRVGEVVSQQRAAKIGSKKAKPAEKTVLIPEKPPTPKPKPKPKPKPATKKPAEKKPDPAIARVIKKATSLYARVSVRYVAPKSIQAVVNELAVLKKKDLEDLYRHMGFAPSGKTKAKLIELIKQRITEKKDAFSASVKINRKTKTPIVSKKPNIPNQPAGGDDDVLTAELVPDSEIAAEALRDLVNGSSVEYDISVFKELRLLVDNISWDQFDGLSRLPKENTPRNEKNLNAIKSVMHARLDKVAVSHMANSVVLDALREQIPSSVSNSGEFEQLAESLRAVREIDEYRLLLESSRPRIEILEDDDIYYLIRSDLHEAVGDLQIVAKSKLSELESEGNRLVGNVIAEKGVNKFSFDYTEAPGVSAGAVSKINAAGKFLSQVFAVKVNEPKKSDIIDDIINDVVWAEVQHDDNDGSVKDFFVKIDEDKRGRAFYDPVNATVNLSYIQSQSHPLFDELAAVTVHEVGHAIESGNKWINDACLKFRERRARDAGHPDPAPYNEGPGGGAYMVYLGNEGYYQGGAAKYVGRVYLSGSTEVFSMGLEAMFKAPAEFVAKDPEYAGFIMSIVKGYHKKAGGA